MKHLITLLIVVSFLFLTSCRKYDTPEFVTIESDETAFVVALDGNASDAVKFDSIDALNKAKVGCKRVQIPHRWVDTGRMYWDGDYIATIRVITVKRTPVTRQWEPTQKAGSNAIWVESTDSVGFSTGFSVVAKIEEEDCAKFLYNYKGNSLANVIDTEVRARIQSCAAGIASRYNMDILRSKKEELIDKVRADVVPFFKNVGITITTVGQFGGFEYENDNIQKSIDDVFIAQQLKNVASAKLDAQADINKRLMEEGRGEADKMREIAKGKKDSAILEAEGESQRILEVAKAMESAQKSPLFMQMKQIEVSQKSVEKWDGKFPVYMMGGNQNSAPLMMLNMPAVK